MGHRSTKNLWLPTLLACTAASAGIGLAACSSEEERTSFGLRDDAEAPAPEASLPPNASDAGISEASSPDAKPPFDASDATVVCAQKPCAVELVAGTAHFCARMDDGTIRCWGDNTRGSLGGGEDVAMDIGIAPVAVLGVSNATQISAAAGTTCARLADGKVTCWGDNASGQLGLTKAPATSDFEPHASPSPAAIDVLASRVDVGERSVCAVGQDGKLLCWGANDKKQLARAEGEPLLGPGTSDARGNTILGTGEGRDSTFALTSDGRLLGWGVIWGRAASITPDAVPFALPSLSEVTAFAVTSTHACAIAGGVIHCWGAGDLGALGTGLPDEERAPVGVHVAADDGIYPQRISVSETSTCARLTDGTVECCGDDTHAQLGRGQVGDPSPFFAKATAFTGSAVTVATSAKATCVLTLGGTVQCWGANGSGELGRGTHDEDAHPIPITVAFP